MKTSVLTCFCIVLVIGVALGYGSFYGGYGEQFYTEERPTRGLSDGTYCT